MFDTGHYVPVLKLKRGEKKALRLVTRSARDRITPLLEIVERRGDKTLDAHLDTTFHELGESLRGYPGCFLDAREIANDRASAAEQAFDAAAATGIQFVPVTGISRSADVAAALKSASRGVALRLTRSDLEGGELASRIDAFCARYRLVPDATDLILDLGDVGDMIFEGISALAQYFVQEIPDPTSWRTLTLSASAFPLSMGVVDRKSHAFVDRLEWLAWRDQLRFANGLARIPTFSDCGIQHPIGVEGFDPRIMQVSATIRYTRPDQWLLVKGESTRMRAPTVQFPELAKQLAYGHLRHHFDGAGHCEGCRSIKAAADGAPGFGSAEAWRRIGTVHHLTRVAADLATLFGS